MTETGSGKIGKSVLEGGQAGRSGAGAGQEGTREPGPEGDRGGSVWSPGKQTPAGSTGGPEPGRGPVKNWPPPDSAIGARAWEQRAVLKFSVEG